MELGRRQGMAIAGLGVILLTAAILVLISVPSWGRWIADYPAQVAQSLPADGASPAQGILMILGPLMEQIGGYMQIVGYFAGSLLTIFSLVPLSTGMMIIRTDSRPT